MKNTYLTPIQYLQILDGNKRNKILQKFEEGVT